MRYLIDTNAQPGIIVHTLEDRDELLKTQALYQAQNPKANLLIVIDEPAPDVTKLRR